jgi:nucleotide-binding universal stress UspA family protein
VACGGDSLAKSSNISKNILVQERFPGFPGAWVDSKGLQRSIIFPTEYGGGNMIIPEIKKILYATDLSENARYAFSYAMSIANRYGAGITILHVLEDISPFRDSLVINILGDEKWNELRKHNEQHVIDTLKSRLEQFCKDVAAELPACPFITDEIVVKTGNPPEEILNQLEKTNCDLIVMGAHGHGVLRDAAVGSVSRRVLRRSKKPVFVVRLPEEEKS